MTTFPHHSQQRSAEDRLDVTPLLHQGLSGAGEHCVFACEGRDVSVAKVRVRVACLQTHLRRLGLRSKQRVAVHLVERADVLPRSLEVAREQEAKPTVAMRLDKRRFQEMTEPFFRAAIEAAVRHHRESYESNEPARMMEEFYKARGGDILGSRANA